MTEPTNSSAPDIGDTDTDPDYDPTAWLEYVDQLMKLHGISSSRFATELGSARSLITHWRRGTRPRLEILRKIADVYRRPFAELLVASGWATADEVGLGPNSRLVSQVSDVELLRLNIARLQTLVQDAGEFDAELPVEKSTSGTVMTARRTKADSKVTTVRSRPAGRVSDQ